MSLHPDLLFFPGYHALYQPLNNVLPAAGTEPYAELLIFQLTCKSWDPL